MSLRRVSYSDEKSFSTHLKRADAATGEEVWRVKAAEVTDSYSMTVAPLVANGVLITGISGQW